MAYPWALLLVFSALGALYLVLRLIGQNPVRRTPRLRVLETCGLASKAHLHLVEVDGETLLVGSGEHGVSLLRAGALRDEAAHDERNAPLEDAAAAATLPAEPRALRALRHLPSLSSLGLFVVAFVMLAAGQISAQEASAGPELVLSLGGGDRNDVAPALELLALLTVVSIAPSILLMGTCFTRIVIVLAFVRQAVGVQHLPPNQVLAGLALFITLFVMAPVGEQVHTQAWIPYVAEEISLEEATDRAFVPIRRFLLQHTREADLELFVELSVSEEIEDIDEVPTSTLLPAFLISELRTAFEIGFMIFLPFLVIDLVISSMLISMGMIVLPPVIVALPFKIMLFVLSDGWNLILGSLIEGLR